MITLFVTMDTSYGRARKMLPQVGLQKARVTDIPGMHLCTFRVKAPTEGYAGCVRSLAFNLGTPVLMQVQSAKVAHLVMPLRTHPADMAELEVAP